MHHSRVYVAGYHNSVSCFVLDPDTGTLTLLSASNAGPNPTYLAWHPSGSFMYAANEVAPGRISAYAIDAQDGRLAPINNASSAGCAVKNATAHVAFAPSGRFVYGSNRGHDSVVVYALDAETGSLRLVAHELGGGAIAVPRDFTFDPTGRCLLVASQLSNCVTVFRCDAATGLLHKLTTTVVPPAPAFVGVMPAKESGFSGTGNLC